MEKSKYQIAALDAVSGGTHNMFVKAVAGSGKSTLIKWIAELFMKDWDGFQKDVLACAFNNHIVKDLTPKMPPNTLVKTMHSLGYEAWRNYMAPGRVVMEKGFKTDNILKTRLARGGKFYPWKSSINKIISLFKAHGPSLWGVSGEGLLDSLPLKAIQVKDVGEQIISDYSIKMPKMRGNDSEEYWSALTDVWNHSLKDKLHIDFDDMIFMPVLYQVAVPTFTIALFDEFQDMNPVQIDFALMLNCRSVAVGDPKQSIYAFRGADVKAIENYIQRANATLYPLSICYRCPISVVKEAQKYVPEIEWAPNAIEGKVERILVKDYRKVVQDSDYILCRCTAPLVTECLGMIRDGRKATVKGRDIGAKLIETIDDIGSSDFQSTESFYDALKAYESAKLEKLNRTGNREGEIMQLADQVDTLIVLLEECKTVGEMKKRIDSIFSDDAVGITYCTVHKAKGLESKNIFIIEPDLMPHKLAETATAIEQENNLIYVAITRSLENLYWVDGKVSTLKNPKSGDETEKFKALSPDEKLAELFKDKPQTVGEKYGQPESMADILSREVIGGDKIIEQGKEVTVKVKAVEAGRTVEQAIKDGTYRPVDKTVLDDVYKEDDSTKDAAAKMNAAIASGVDPEKALEQALLDLQEMD